MERRIVLSQDKATSTYQEKFFCTTENAVYLLFWIAVCDYLLLIIAEKHFNIPKSRHTISKSIGPFLFKQDGIRSIFKVTKELSINSPESIYRGYLFLDFIRTLITYYSIPLIILSAIHTCNQNALKIFPCF